MFSTWQEWLLISMLTQLCAGVKAANSKLKMAVAATPLHFMATVILSPVTVLVTTVVTPCLTRDT